MYRAGIEGILGIRREADFITIEPRIPPAWPGFEATIELDSTRFDINVMRRSVEHAGAKLDGAPIDCDTGKVRVLLDGKAHELSIEMQQTAPGMANEASQRDFAMPNSDLERSNLAYTDSD
jgi:cyclic beta-1,2-glucan synthetase